MVGTVKTNLTLIVVAAACSLSMARGTEALKLDAKPERSLLQISGGESVLQVEVRGRKTPSEKRKIPLNLAVVLDRSSSMSGQKIDQARQAALVALDEISEGDIFSLVIYSNEVEVIIPAGPVRDKAEIEKKISAIQARGGTALYAGVQGGAEQLRKHFSKEKINRVILLSDGQANVGPSSTEELSKLGSTLAGEGISVSTIGLGESYNEDLMTALAESSEANYYFVKDAEKLPEVFADELGTVKSVVARNLRLIITLPEGLEGTGVLGDETIRFEGRTLTIPLSEMSGGQTRRFLIGVKVPPGEEKEVKIADVRLAYLDTEGRAQNTEAAVSAERTADAAASAASVKPEVGTSVAVVRNRLAKEKAVAYADEGRTEEAAKILQQQAAENAALPAAVQNDVLRKDTDALTRHANTITSAGSLSPAARKEIKFENYQDKLQKR